MKRWKLRLCALTTAVLLLLPLVAFSAPRAQAYGATQQLVIKVGYAGLPFYEKAVYSIAELEVLGTHSALYTFLDAGGFACYAQAEGVYLTDIMDAAGIDLSAVARCHFLTTDSGGGYFTSPTASTLFRSQYAFPLLSQYYGEPPGELGRRITDYDAVWANAAPVAAMLSLRDNFGRVDEFTEYDASLYPMTSAKQLRLFFGQSYPDEINARNMGYWVYEIDVELAGFPTMLTTQEQLKLTVGSNQQAQVQVTAADELVTQAILQGLQWKSDNPDAVTVDASGVLTVVGEGEANITVFNEEYGLRFKLVVLTFRLRLVHRILFKLDLQFRHALPIQFFGRSAFARFNQILIEVVQVRRMDGTGIAFFGVFTEMLICGDLPPI